MRGLWASGSRGQAIRVFQSGLLRRSDLPRVALAPDTEPERERYFYALEAADRHDWQALVSIWQDRFTTAGQQPGTPS